MHSWDLLLQQQRRAQTGHEWALNASFVNIAAIFKTQFLHIICGQFWHLRQFFLIFPHLWQLLRVKLDWTSFAGETQFLFRWFSTVIFSFSIRGIVVTFITLFLFATKSLHSMASKRTSIFNFSSHLKIWCTRLIACFPSSGIIARTSIFFMFAGQYGHCRECSDMKTWTVIVRNSEPNSGIFTAWIWSANR